MPFCVNVVYMEYSIDAVARLTGISAFTLRNWEKRYDFLRPKRLDNGFRAYGDEHVEMLRKVAALLRHGARIGDLAESIRKGKPLPEVRTPELAPEVQEQAKQLYTALMDYNQDRAEAIHSELSARFSTQQMLDLIYSPLLSRMGRDWNTGETTLAQEHFASAFIRLRLAPLLTMTHHGAASSRKKVICATASGELHEGGLMLITAHLKLKGWSTFYLGSNLPLEDVRAAAQTIEPHLICLSFTDKHAFRAAIPLIQEIRCKVCVGGFGALTFDGEDTLPPHLHLLKNSGKEAAEMIEMIEKS
jgi:methanogenic corrinoid protein MtbC1